MTAKPADLPADRNSFALFHGIKSCHPRAVGVAPCLRGSMCFVGLELLSHHGEMAVASSRGLAARLSLWADITSSTRHVNSLPKRSNEKYSSWAFPELLAVFIQR